MSSAQRDRIKYSGSLGSQNVFASLPKSITSHLESRITFSRHAAGSIIYRQGEVAAGVFLVFEGRIRLSAVGCHARTALLGIAEPGDTIGLAAALLERPYLTSAVVAESSSVALLPRDELLQAMLKYPDLNKAVIRTLALECLETAAETLSLRVPGPTSEKLAGALLRLADGKGKSFDQPQLSYTHTELAQLVGASRETITRMMQTLESEGAIVNGKSTVRIADWCCLKQIAGFE